MYIPKFYSDVVGVPVVVIGTIMLAGRIVDAVTDPVLGMISDRVRSRWGRRRPFLLLGAVPLVLAFWMLIVPPSLQPSQATVWLVVSLLLLQLAFTVVVVRTKRSESKSHELTMSALSSWGCGTGSRCWGCWQPLRRHRWWAGS